MGHPKKAALMTVAQVRDRVQAIAAARHDPESAHCAEDKLHRDVLAGIAMGARNPNLLADEALRTTAIDFPRWAA